ncbi:hypothetical protein N7528_007790 [Penicillium herquei]|nr:hypothetical protein N7528_007790 [Penicillium herquei]
MAVLSVMALEGPEDKRIDPQTLVKPADWMASLPPHLRDQWGVTLPDQSVEFYSEEDMADGHEKVFAAMKRFWGHGVPKSEHSQDWDENVLQFTLMKLEMDLLSEVAAGKEMLTPYTESMGLLLTVIERLEGRVGELEGADDQSPEAKAEATKKKHLLHLAKELYKETPREPDDELSSSPPDQTGSALPQSSPSPEADVVFTPTDSPPLPLVTSSPQNTGQRTTSQQQRLLSPIPEEAEDMARIRPIATLPGPGSKSKKKKKGKKSKGKKQSSQTTSLPTSILEAALSETPTTMDVATQTAEHEWSAAPLHLEGANQVEPSVGSPIIPANSAGSDEAGHPSSQTALTTAQAAGRQSPTPSEDTDEQELWNPWWNMHFHSRNQLFWQRHNGRFEATEVSALTRTNNDSPCHFLPDCQQHRGTQLCWCPECRKTPRWCCCAHYAEYCITSSRRRKQDLMILQYPGSQSLSLSSQHYVSPLTYPGLARSAAAEVTTAEAITAEATTAEATTAQVTFAEITTAEATIAEATTAQEVTLSEVNTAEVTTAEVTTAEATTAEATIAEATTAQVTSAEITTAEATTPEATIGEATTAQVTFAEITTAEVTTDGAIIAEATTAQVTSPEVTTARTTTRRANNRRASTSRVSTPRVNTTRAATAPATTAPATAGDTTKTSKRKKTNKNKRKLNQRLQREQEQAVTAPAEPDPEPEPEPEAQPALPAPPQELCPQPSDAAEVTSDPPSEDVVFSSSPLIPEPYSRMRRVSWPLSLLSIEEVYPLS